MFQKILHISLSFLALSLAFSAVVAVREWQLTNRQLRSAVNEAQWLIAETRPELRETLKQAKLGSFELRRELKALGEDLNSREQQRARLATMRAGESVAALASRIETDTLPLLNQNLRSADGAVIAAAGLLRNTDASLNTQLLPEAARLLASLRATSDAFGVDSRAVLAELVTITRQGQTSLEAVNKVLASPEWLETLKNVERSTGNIADTTAELPETAKSVERILRTTASWQKPMLLASLLATLARAFIP